jgi:hypothetical protein
VLHSCPQVPAFCPAQAAARPPLDSRSSSCAPPFRRLSRAGRRLAPPLDSARVIRFPRCSGSQTPHHKTLTTAANEPKPDEGGHLYARAAVWRLTLRGCRRAVASQARSASLERRHVARTKRPLAEHILYSAPSSAKALRHGNRHVRRCVSRTIRTSAHSQSRRAIKGTKPVTSSDDKDGPKIHAAG